MGYTHYWSVQRSHPDYATAWPTLIDDTRRIIDAVRATGVVIAGPDGYRRPILDPAHGIALNGDATTDLDYEALHPAVTIAGPGLHVARSARPRGAPTTWPWPRSCCAPGCCCPRCS